MVATVDYEVSPIIKLRYFHNIFDSEAKYFHGNNKESIFNTFEEACTGIRNDFSSTARQDRVRKYLQNLSLTSIIEKKSCTVSEALEQLCEIITNFTSHGSMTHKSEEDMVEYLYDATTSMEGAQMH